MKDNITAAISLEDARAKLFEFVLESLRAGIELCERAQSGEWRDKSIKNYELMIAHFEQRRNDPSVLGDFLIYCLSREDMSQWKEFMMHAEDLQGVKVTLPWDAPAAAPTPKIPDAEQLRQTFPGERISFLQETVIPADENEEASTNFDLHRLDRCRSFHSSVSWDDVIRKAMEHR